MNLLGGILDIGSKVIDRVIPDPEEKQKAMIQLQEMQQNGELQELQTRMSAILAEANSKDPWTSRARPSFMYVMYAMILFSIPMGILSGFNPEMAQAIANGMTSYLNAIPDGLWATFGIGYTGYAAVRSYDKKNLNKNT